MKRKSFALIIFVLVLVFALAGLVGCDKNGDQSTYTLKIEGIVGVSDPVIDNDAKTVAFRVQNSINAFALGSIQFSNDEMLVYEAYSDAALTKKYDGDSVPLVEGENVFWVKGWFSIAPDKYEVYEFSVTRTAAEVTVTAIAVDTATWKSEYLVNEVFGTATLIVTKSDNSTENVEITADMLTGFDTSAPGTKTVTITYGGNTTTATITVKEPVVETSALSLGDWQSVYFVGEEILLDGATVLYDNGTETVTIGVTADMIAGFDTTSAGDKSVTITYAGNKLTVTIKVYDLESGIYGDVAKSEIDDAKFKAILNDLAGLVNVEITEEFFEENLTYIKSIIEYLGVTNEELQAAADVLTSSDNTLVADFFDMIMIGEEKEVTAIFTKANVAAVTEILRIVKDSVDAKQIAKVGLLIAKLIVGDMEEIFSGSQDIEREYRVYFIAKNDNFHGGSSVMLTTSEILEFVGTDMRDYFDEYVSDAYFSENTKYGAMYDMLCQDAPTYIAGALLDSVATACDYDADKVYGLVSFGVKVAEAVIDGDIGALLGGSADGLSYKEMAAQINELGKLFKTANETFIEDPIVVRYISDFLGDIIELWASGTSLEGFDANHAVNAIAAAEKMAFDALSEIKAETAMALYADYDDYAKEKDEGKKNEKLGYFIADIAAFVRPYYDKLELVEKNALLNLDKLARFIGIEIDTEEIVSVMIDASAKDADDFTADELKAFAARIISALDDSVTNGVNEIRVYKNGSILVPVGVSKEDLAKEMASQVQIVFKDGKLGTTLVIDDLAAYAMDYDASKEGFFDVTLTIEGASAVIECYAYDSSSLSKFTVFDDEIVFDGYTFIKGQTVSLGPADKYISLKHKDTGRQIQLPFIFTGLEEADTSVAGKTMTFANYENEIMGTIKIPALVCVVDPENITADDIQSVYFDYCDILPLDTEIRIEATIRYGYLLESDAVVTVSGLDNTSTGKKTFTATYSATDFAYENTAQLEVTVVTLEEAMTVTWADVSADEEEVVVTLGASVNDLMFHYDVDYKYYPANNNNNVSGTFEDLNANELAVHGLKLTVEGFDTSVITEIGELKTATIRLVSAANESIVYAENTFEYSVYDEASEPPVVISIDEDLDWDLRNGVFTQSELSSVNTFFNTVIERFYYPSMHVVYSDGTNEKFDIIMENGGFDESQSKIVLTQKHDYGGYKSYGVDVYVGYAHIEIGEIDVIPDALKNIPTSMSVSYKIDVIFSGYRPDVLIDEPLTVDSVYAEIELGYGYDKLKIYGADEKEKFTVSGDVSEEGMKQLTVTYTMSGVTLSAECNVNVITLEEALSYDQGNVDKYSYRLDPDNANEDALLGMISTGKFLSYKEFEVDAYNLKAANEEWAGKGLNVRFAIRNADGELDAFDGTEGTLRSCTLVIIASCYGHDAEVEVATIRYSVANADIDKVSGIDYVSIERSVITETERTSGTWKDLVSVQYTKAGEKGDAVLSDLLAQNADLTAELVYDTNDEGYYIVIEGEHAYYDYSVSGYITVIPDGEATKVTGIRVDVINQEYIGYAPVAGKNYTIMVEYGYGVSEKALEDYSAVTVSLAGMYEYYYVYEISYMGNTAQEQFYCVENVSLNFDGMGYIAYQKGGDLNDVRIFGEIFIEYNYGHRSRNYDCEGKTLAEINAEFEIIEVEIVVSGLDLSLGTEEQGEVTLSCDGKDPYRVIAIEMNRTFVENVSLTNVVYTLGCDPSEVRISADVENYVVLDETGQIFSSGSFNEYDVTLADLNEYYYDSYGMTFELIGLDTSLPADEQFVYLKVNNATSNEVTPTLATE